VWLQQQQEDSSSSIWEGGLHDLELMKLAISLRERERERDSESLVYPIILDYGLQYDHVQQEQQHNLCTVMLENQQ
jgi:hypothetical protein